MIYHYCIFALLLVNIKSNLIKQINRMKPQDYAKLEKNYNFKRRYLNKTLWWKNILLIAPIGFLFIGLAGVIYLLKNDLLASLYVIPYLILFVIGTIWLKAIKRHIQKAKMAEPNAFRVCLAKPVMEDDKLVFSVFVNDTHRHNNYYIKNLADKINIDALLETDNNLSKIGTYLINDPENEIEYYLNVSAAKEITKMNAKWNNDNMFPVLYIDDKYTFIVKAKDLVFYTKE